MYNNGADSTKSGNVELKHTSEAVFQRYSVKKLFFKISQSSQENTCVRVCLFFVFFFDKVAAAATLFKKRLQHSCFPVNFVKFLRSF